MAEARIVRIAEGDVYEDIWLFKQGSLIGGRFDFMVGNIGYLTGPPLHLHGEQDDTFFVLGRLTCAREAVGIRRRARPQLLDAPGSSARCIQRPRPG